MAAELQLPVGYCLRCYQAGHVPGEHCPFNGVGHRLCRVCKSPEHDRRHCTYVCPYCDVRGVHHGLVCPQRPPQPILADPHVTHEWLAPLDRISWALLAALPLPATSRHIPVSATNSWLRAFSYAHTLADHPQPVVQARGQKLVYLLPRLLLGSYDVIYSAYGLARFTAARHHGKPGLWAKTVRTRCALLLNRQLDTLLSKSIFHPDKTDADIIDVACIHHRQQEEARPDRPVYLAPGAADHLDDDQFIGIPASVQEYAARHIAVNQISRGANGINNASPTFVTATNQPALDACFPVGEPVAADALTPPDDEVQYLFTNSQDAVRLLRQAIRKSPKKSAAGPDGAYLEHYRLLISSNSKHARLATVALSTFARFASRIERNDDR